MKIKECITCGAHEFKNGKCAYCGNQYEFESESKSIWSDDENSYGEKVEWITQEAPQSVWMDEKDDWTEEDKRILKIGLSIVFGLAAWFVVLVALPAIVLPLTFIAIGFIIWKLLKK